MSELEKLIKKHCPNGVEYKTLGEVCEYGKERISAEMLNVENYISVEGRFCLL